MPHATSLMGFGHLRRFRDRHHDVEAVWLLPGEFYASDRPEVIVTVLGSCIAACLRDPIAGVSGMNHFMLPDRQGPDIPLTDESARYGVHAMEMLINQMLARGAHKDRLEAKLSGGGQMMSSSEQIGHKNIAFARQFLNLEGIPLLGEHVGGPVARRVYFFGDTGRVRVRRIDHGRELELVQQERSYRQRITTRPVAGEIELF